MRSLASTAYLKVSGSNAFGVNGTRKRDKALSTMGTQRSVSVSVPSRLQGNNTLSHMNLTDTRWILMRFLRLTPS